MLNKNIKIIELLNTHYNLEQSAANLYTQYSTIANKLGFKYTAKFLKKISDDKIIAHLPRIYKYLIDIDAEVLINQHSLPKHFEHNNDMLKIMNEMLDNELRIRKHINHIAEYALAIKDFETYAELEWFIKDALKDVNDFKDIVSIFEDAKGANTLLIEQCVRNWLKENNDE